jgi:hypothetical protein
VRSADGAHGAHDAPDLQLFNMGQPALPSHEVMDLLELDPATEVGQGPLDLDTPLIYGRAPHFCRYQRLIAPAQYLEGLAEHRPDVKDGGTGIQRLGHDALPDTFLRHTAHVEGASGVHAHDRHAESGLAEPPSLHRSSSLPSRCV